MSTIKDKFYFNFNGISSKTFNLLHISLDGSMFEETLVAGREINETKIAGNDKPSFNRLELSPREFDLNLAFETVFTDTQIDKIVRWLFTDYYKPLYFEGDESKVMYCIPVGDPTLVHNGLKQGYFTLRMRCNSPFLYSPIVISELLDLTEMDKTVILSNRGHKKLYPEISIQKIGDGDITIVNKTDGSNTSIPQYGEVFNGHFFEIKQLTNMENIYINCEKEIIQTDVLGVYRYNNVFGEYPRLLFGENTLEIKGRCKVQFRYQEIYEF